MSSEEGGKEFPPVLCAGSVLGLRRVVRWGKHVQAKLSHREEVEAELGTLAQIGRSAEWLCTARGRRPTEDYGEAKCRCELISGRFTEQLVET
jgi:hypothetical protein